MLEFGLVFGKLLGFVINSLRIDGVGQLLAVFIFIVFIIILVFYLYKYLFYRHTLKKAINLISSVADREKFYGDFSRVDSDLKKIKGLSNCWEEFKKTLIYPEQSGESIIQNTSRPSFFFNADEAGFDTPLARIWPNIFVGIGLLITFAGLISALTAAVGGLEGDTDTVQKAVVDLLITTSAKFYTSLVALLSSIIMSFSFKWGEKIRDKKFVELSTRLEERLEYISVEQITQKQLMEIKNQTEALQGFSSDLAIKLGNTIEKAMEPVAQEIRDVGKRMVKGATTAVEEAAGSSLGHLSNELNNLTNVLGGMSKNLEQSASAFEVDMSKSIKEMSNNMGELLGKLQDDFSKKADDTSKELEKAIKNLTEASESSTKQMGEALSNISKQVEKDFANAGKNAADKFDNAGKTIGGLSADLVKTQDSMKKLDESLGDISSKLTDATKDINKNLKALNDGTEKMKEATLPVQEATKNIQSSTEKMNNYVTRSTNEIREALSQLENEMRKNSQSWEKHSQQFDGVNEKLGEVFQKVNSQIEDSQKRMTEFVTELDNSFSNAINVLGGAIEELSDTLETKNK